MILLDSVEVVDSAKSRDNIRCKCEKCGIEFFNPKNIVLRALKGSSKGKYCSVECKLKSRQKKSSKCKWCSKIFNKNESKQQFCKQSCAASFNNENRKIVRECLNCKEKSIKKNARKYCSQFCGHEFRKNVFLIDWQNGNIKVGEKGFALSIRIRNFLFKKFNYSCSECGWNKVNSITNKVPLQIHHKDGDATNNIESNLQVLCPNCHSLTKNFGRLNKNGTRKWRYCQNLCKLD